MGTIFIGIALLAIFITGVAEYRRQSQAKARRTAFAKRTERVKIKSNRGR